jgi:hypothetical protein
MSASLYHITVKKEDFDITVEQIADAVAQWKDFPGFAGETCEVCHRTANLINRPMWICVCHAVNWQSFNGTPMLHDKPDLGPTKEEIEAGVEWGTNTKARLEELELP